MDPVSIFLLVVASIFLIGILGEIAFTRTGVPDVIWLILVGVGLSATGLVERTQLREIAPFFGAITLVVVLFDGGSQLRLGELGKAAQRGTLLAFVSFVLAAASVAGASLLAVRLGLLPDSWTFLHCVTLGAILGGSSSVVIMPALAKAGLSARIRNLVSLESALTDVLSIVTTGALVSLAVSGHAGPEDAAILFVRSFGIGIAVGTAVGLLAVLALRSLRKNSYAYPLVLGTLLILFVVVDSLGGSAALAILAAAVIVGNGPRISQFIGLAKTARLAGNVTGVHSEITFIVKSFFFTFIGAMIGPPWGLVGLGAVLAVILLLARVPSVWLSTLGAHYSPDSRRLVAVLMPRGMAAGVMAMLPHQAGMPGMEQLPVLVFAAVFGTILLFAAGFPVVRKRVPEEDREAPGEAADVPSDADVSRTAWRREPDVTRADDNARAAGGPGASAPSGALAGGDAGATVARPRSKSPGAELEPSRPPQAAQPLAAAEGVSPSSDPGPKALGGGSPGAWTPSAPAGPDPFATQSGSLESPAVTPAVSGLEPLTTAAPGEVRLRVETDGDAAGEESGQ